MDFSIPPHIEDLRGKILRFVEDKIYPWESTGFRYDEENFPKCSEDHEYIRGLQAEVKANGWWAPHLPVEAGGMGLSVLEYGLVNEILGRSYYAPRVFGCNAPDSGNAEILWEFGSDEQKEKYFTPLATGEARSYFGMTEPHTSGSDPRNLVTSAVRDGDEWVINGTKWYSTNANGAAFGIVMAVTDPNDSGYRRQSQIIVPSETSGVTFVRPISVMGHTVGAGHWVMRYEDVRVPVSNTLGEVGAGFAIAQHRLGPGRIHHCMRWLGQAQRAFDIMCSYAHKREAFDSTLAEKQTVQNWIADSAAEMQASRLMTLQAAWMIDREGQKGARVEISLIKFYGAQMLMNVLDRAIQVMGGLGVSDDTPVAFMWRQARASRIYDGPDEVHRMVVARRILKQYRPD